jgi:type III secretion protein V
VHDTLVDDVTLDAALFYYTPRQVPTVSEQASLQAVQRAGQYCYLFAASQPLLDIVPLSHEQLIAHVLSFKITQKANDLFGMQEVRNLINTAESHVPDLTAEVQRALPLQRIADVLKRLVDEGVSVRNIGRIFESLIIWGSKEKDINMLTEYIRVDIGQAIVSRYTDAQGVLHNAIFEQATEAALKQALQQSNLGNFIALPKDKTDALMAQIEQLHTGQADASAVIIVSFELRRYVKKLIEPIFPNIAVLSYQEIKPETKLNTLAAIKL